MTTLDYFLGRTPKIVIDKDAPGVVTDKDAIEQNLVKLSEQGVDFENRYGPISEEEYQIAITDLSPDERAWEQAAAWRLYPKAAAAAVVGVGVGFYAMRMYTQKLLRNRRDMTKLKGAKYVREDDTMKSIMWVEDKGKVTRHHCLGGFIGLLLSLNLSVKMLYPAYLEEIASMPNSRMSLAVKRMHRQAEMRESITMRPVTEEDVDRTRHPLENRDARNDANLSPELAASRAASQSLSGGYKAGGI
eukprot:Rhum_TRINITY_DN5374_c0_g1::Rhum_TRINITY_DN5374_c0_g1_i1::g.17238::m.17238